MARAWVYDRSKTRKYQEATQKAKAARRKPPARWAVMYYDRTGRLRSEVIGNKAKAEERRAELEGSLATGTYVDPASGKASVAEMAEKWLESRHDLRRSRRSPTRLTLSGPSTTGRRRVPA